MDPTKLLLVDDEPALLELMHRYLIGLGYHVDSCRDGREACRKFSSAVPGSYALVLADMSLPDIDGEILLARLLEIDPRARILVCSGYPFEISRLPRQLPHQFAFLQKPFLPKMLAGAVARILAGKPLETD